ncbi:hypothetical protein [Siansivirga zeaxanthinifaciens]|uniref:DUF4296 domain-containing protein n=1 Tax=Siansivirga zeaxanthinifaciens CC-SAMT-1 TaxID=1454006 RepID=A0A0C5WCS6_9FLAO|nr:hypothetical protein [Siansivirga zeaxanthinifaciens]AJR04838.1 hypothetical protein AW14_06825 [Siansivirga zeaxanthinifaciens CC-SAMT-1]
MKTILKKPNVTTIVASMLLAVVISFTTACETENTTQGDYADAEYLDLEKYHKDKMKEKDFITMFKAIKRLEISRVNGFYKIKESTAEDLNISPKLFNYITAGFDYSNNILNPKVSIRSKITKLKYGN